MKKNLSMLAAVLTASAALTGCSSELAEVQKQVQAEEAQTYTLVINATKPGNDALTRAISEAGGGLSTSWAEGEKVYAYLSDTGDPVSVTLTEEDIDASNPKKATLKFTFTKEGGFDGSESFTLYYLQPKTAYGNYSNQKGTLADIAANFDFMKATVNVTAVGPTSIYGNSNILATQTANFQRQQAITKFTLTEKGSAPEANFDITHSVPLNIKAGDDLNLTVTPNEGQENPNIIWVALPLSTEKAYKFEATSDSKAYGTTKTVALTDANYYTASLKMGRDIEKVSVTGIPTTGDAPSQKYSGSAVNISSVSNNESDAMEEGEENDYIINYYRYTGPSEPEWTEISKSEVVNADKYKAVIEGKGKYEGTEEYEFTIAKTTTSEVEDAINQNTIPATTDLATTLIIGEDTPIVKEGKDVLGMDSKDLKDNNYVSITTAPDGIATINENGEIVTTGGGTITLTISLPESDNYEEASVVKTIYVKQSGIGGTLDDPTTGSWDD